MIRYIVHYSLTDISLDAVNTFTDVVSVEDNIADAISRAYEDVEDCIKDATRVDYDEEEYRADAEIAREDNLNTMDHTYSLTIRFDEYSAEYYKVKITEVEI